MSRFRNSPMPREADDAFRAHAALLRAETQDRSLLRNPHWTMLKQDAYERFCIAMERVR